ncbi:SixA phosphatase family protein [Poseidonocella sedimentorum]|uniref:Phosphohistidine phosphatase n=1 Tax=Poseidonocella sedimentorum TaxID=871652 RepID=A0A1I6DMS5_9RHOB|nr:histidine phosphatase family protein [Poseidonocella sedimentorum]SFR06668.1 phosphohistidine phosphatase [Poseidonocella sedimentorum]
MRHAKSDWSSGDADHDRPLNSRGRLAAGALGDWLTGRGVLPDEILCSSARRCCETLAGLALDAPAKLQKRLYLAGPSTMFDALTAANGNAVLMIGHNPGIADFAMSLVTRPPKHTRFSDYPTGATLVLDFDIASWDALMPGTGRVVDFIVPRELA